MLLILTSYQLVNYLRDRCDCLIIPAHHVDDDHLHVSTYDQDFSLVATKTESDNKDEAYMNMSFHKMNVELKIDTFSQ